jgi:hypothetical protein
VSIVLSVFPIKRESAISLCTYGIGVIAPLRLACFACFTSASVGTLVYQITVDNHVDTKLAFLKEPMVSIVLSCSYKGKYLQSGICT